MNPLRFAFRVLAADRRTRVSTILTGVGVAVATAVVLLLMSLPSASDARTARSYWQAPHPRSADAETMLIRSSTDYFEGSAIRVVAVAPTGDSSRIALPPGVPRLPRPGEVLVSQALADRMHAVPAARLADRYPGVVGTITDAGLEYPGQLIALVGHTPKEISESAAKVDGFGDPAKVQADPFLKFLAGVGVVVLLIPSLVLVASSSRLTAARRERRLAALRLAGADPGQVTAMVAAETGVAALAGALLGALCEPLLGRLVEGVPWNGGTWMPGDFAIPLAEKAALAGAIVVMVLVAAVAGLRRVVNNPLAAASAQTPKPLRAWRLLAAPIAGGLFLFTVLDQHADANFALLGLALVVFAAVVIGPWVTFAVGALFLRWWRRPAGLLTGRRLRDDPRGAYRATAGVVLAVLVGTMALTIMPSLTDSLAGEAPNTIRTYVYADEPASVVDRINADLARYGQPVRASAYQGQGKLEGSISVPTDGADREVVRTAVTKEAGGGDVISPADDLAGNHQMLDDIRRITAIGLIAACVLAGCSAAIATAGSVMDRRRTFGALMAAGTPVRVLSRALRAEAAVPALVATVGAGAAGIGVGIGLLTVATRGHTPVATVLSPWLLAPVVLGIGVALLGASVCTPALNRVRAEPLSDE
ncbi:FtsX-like permease family protein [Amycolatopsis pigmentata]|uniref:FtsX-like permease family protein n=1 Tax=Amycolatopsis pigmentata TaxID=450801 RepID=A0ABW5FTJ5_9PSEU